MQLMGCDWPPVREIALARALPPGLRASSNRRPRVAFQKFLGFGLERNKSRNDADIFGLPFKAVSLFVFFYSSTFVQNIYE